MKYEFVKAKKLIKEGWCQGAIQRTVDGRTHFCAYGAIVEAAWKFRPVSFIAEMRRHFSEEISTSLIGEWNDDPSRTKDEVLAAFDRAIAALPEE